MNEKGNIWYEVANVAAILAVVAMGMVMGIGLGYSEGKKDFETKAIKAGVAYQNANGEFRFMEKQTGVAYYDTNGFFKFQHNTQ